MTVVEFFSSTPIENIAYFLAFNPDNIIFVYDDSSQLERLNDLKKFIVEKSPNTSVIFKHASIDNISDITNVLTEIISTNDETYLDLTGGNREHIFAFGLIYNKYKNYKNLHICRLDVNTGKITDFNNKRLLNKKYLDISAKENVFLHGGSLLRSNIIDDEAAKSTEILWKICKKSNSNWNFLVSCLNELEHYKNELSVDLRVNIDVINLHNIPQRDIKILAVHDFVRLLRKNKLVHEVILNEGKICYTYKSNSIRELLKKAGNVLEWKMYFVAKSCKKEYNLPYFSDVVNGAFIDWDGQTPSPHNYNGTANEIDLLLMRGLVPIFVSCKNGNVPDDELYKLNTVAEHFGSKYTKKILVLTNCLKSKSEMKAFKDRAKDMNIFLIENAYKLSDNAIKRLLKK